MSIKEIIQHIVSVNGIVLKDFKAVSGGDISAAYLLRTANGPIFLKINTGQEAEHMFAAEASGLNLIASTKSIKVPEVIAHGRELKHAYLLMEAVITGKSSFQSMTDLGYRLAQLHSCSSEWFGLDHDNYIGSLYQANSRHSTWTDFYMKERLIPQYDLAISRNLLNRNEKPSEESMLRCCDSLFKNIKPSLLHGDLWGGNYLIDEKGNPVLIDPAVYYGHHEVDIAMSRLFGGFPSSFYEAYEERIPRTEGFDRRMELYQLYYLLVHLNLFGQSYYGSVSRLTNNLFDL